MIRDPSDGSVRDTNQVSKRLREWEREAGVPPGPDTGLRQPTRTDAQERLERSRAWLKQYHATKEAAHERGSDIEQEHSSDGRSGNDQGQAEPGL